MIQKVSAPVSVNLKYDSRKRQVLPEFIQWDGKSYPVTKLGYHHTYRSGKTLMHVFSVESPSLFFKINLNTDNLQWTLEEISDGEAD